MSKEYPNSSDVAQEATQEAMQKAEKAEAARRAFAKKQKLTDTIPNLSVQSTGDEPEQVQPAGKRSLKLVILLAVLGVFVLGVAAYALFGPKTIRLSDYFTIAVDGADGYGTARLVWNEAKLQELNRMAAKRNQSAFEAAGGSMAEVISPSLRSDRPDGTLRNGDIVNIRYPDLTEAEKEYRVRFKYFGAVTVTGLKPAVIINLLDHVVFNYEGYDGWGSGRAELDSKNLAVGDLTVTLQQADDGLLQFDLTNGTTGETAIVIYQTDDPMSRLTNGSTLAYNFVSIEGQNSNWLGRYGVELNTETHSYEVQGLAALAQINPYELLTAEYTGFNTRGKVELKLDSDTISTDNGTFLLALQSAEDDGSKSGTPIECWLEIDMEDGFRIRMTAEDALQGTLQNGQEITLRIPAEELDAAGEILAKHGLELSASEKSFLVEGLAELQNINVLNALNVTASGYNGYGVLQASLTEESATAGEYSLHYTLPENEFGMDAVVVDKDGATVYTASYRGEATSLKNNDTVTLAADPEILHRIDEECGIILPESRKYTVSGLKKVTKVEPRDYIKAVFTKKSGKITGTLTLKKESFKAGDYTIRLSVQDESTGDRRKVVFTIVNAAGKELAKGSYTLNHIGAAGTEATIDYNGELDPVTAATLYGLQFDTEPVTVKIKVS